MQREASVLDSKQHTASGRHMTLVNSEDAMKLVSLGFLLRRVNNAKLLQQHETNDKQRGLTDRLTFTQVIR